MSISCAYLSGLSIHCLFIKASKALSTQMSACKQVLRDCMHSQNCDISCFKLMQCSETQPEYDTTAPGPRRCYHNFTDIETQAEVS
jgi:hypothetical protein